VPTVTILVSLILKIGLQGSAAPTEFKARANFAVQSLDSDQKTSGTPSSRSRIWWDKPPRWLKQLAQREGLSHQIRLLEEGVPEVF
jgi:hypothetical protein